MSITLPPPDDADAIERAIAERGPAARQLKRDLDDATATPIFIDYHLGPDWFAGVEDALDCVEAHLAGTPCTHTRVEERRSAPSVRA